MTGKRPPPYEDGLRGDAIRPGEPPFGTVWINPDRMNGAPCLYGPRVPTRNLFDDRRGVHPTGEFLPDVPGVTRAQVGAVLERAPDLVLPQGRAG